ncbi:MAG: hypothetical protein EP329_06015 [Deltaproteobacteria bacterium]|nr:MAG: hypothetical protein EP329_06015 [Deltaproteobacteria bacterium]
MEPAVADPPVAAPPVVAPPMTVERREDAPRVQDPGVEARPWALLVHAGFSIALLDDTPIGDQLVSAGYGTFSFGPSFAVAIQRYVLDWLVVGGALDLRYVETDTAGSDPYSGTIPPNRSSELWRLGASVYVQPTVCLEYGSCKHEGFWMGLQVGAAFGPTWWALRDEVDLGWHARLEAAIVWQGGIDDVIIGFRLLHAMVWQSGMGPRDLGTPFTWLPTADVQLGYRW